MSPVSAVSGERQNDKGDEWQEHGEACQECAAAEQRMLAIQGKGTRAPVYEWHIHRGEKMVLRSRSVVESNLVDKFGGRLAVFGDLGEGERVRLERTPGLDDR